MKTKKKALSIRRIWFWMGSFTIPLSLMILFSELKNDPSLMTGWVFGVMAPMALLLLEFHGLYCRYSLLFG